MSHYRKLVTAVVGLGLMLLHRHIGLDLTGQEAAIVDMAIAGLTAAGVYSVRNEPEEA